MTDDRWKKVADLYESAQDKAAGERSAFVRQASAGDSGLRREVESLLAEDDTPVVLDESLAAAAHAVFADNSGVPADSHSGHPEQRPGVTPGALIGPYRIDGLLGVGGMGEVYRARDTKLNRDVAIKILPAAFAGDPDRLARFKREAQVLASLNHQNIAGIYGLEDAPSDVGSGFSRTLHAIVMELVEGPTLADRIARGPLPVDEALAIARQIADALESAHEQGIIHRDLKPANIKVREDGTVKVLDFGLAKIAEPGGPGDDGRRVRLQPDLTASPTITTPAMTAAGMILGTAAYMSPEQAKGKPADKRSDIWAFGCVLYEMLTGRRPFGGEDVSDTLAEILKSEPQWTALPPDTPRTIRRLLKRCLQKDRSARLQHIGDARLDLLDAARESPDETPSPEPAARRTRERIVWAALAILTLLVGAISARWWRSASAPLADELRLDITPPSATDPFSLALSPDGRWLAFVALPQRQLWIRRMDGSESRAVAGTNGAQYPFWSPDSRSIGFFAANKLQRLEIDGGAPRLLANVLTPAGGSWNREGTIIYVPNSAGKLFTVSADGDGAQTPMRLDDNIDGAHKFPRFLPDGRHFVVNAGRTENSGLYLGALGRGDLQLLAPSDSSASFVAGHLLFGREGTLFARRFDPVSLALVGEARPVATSVLQGSGANTSLTTSESGLIVFRTGGELGRRRLGVFDRAGKELRQVGKDRRTASNPAISPNHQRLAIQDAVGSSSADIWIIDLIRGGDQKFTDHPAIDALPIWSPDGQYIVFNSSRRGVGAYSDLYLKPAAGGPDQLLLSSDDGKFACDWSRDGKFILYRSANLNTGSYDLMALPLQGDKKPIALLTSAADERDAQFEPNNRPWFAYQSDESSRPEIYLTKFPEVTSTQKVSIDGGTQMRWREDGNELYFIGPDNKLMAVKVDWDRNGQPHLGSPETLFPTNIVTISGVSRQQYIPLEHGQQFLINVAADDGRASSMTVIVNWHPDSPARAEAR